jgi:hypothetical protein
MRRFGLMGISVLALTLVFAATASAQDQDTRHVKRIAQRTVASTADAGDPNLPVENALRWGYSQGHSEYPSGFGGLYGDGRYPGNTVTGPQPYNTLR